MTTESFDVTAATVSEGTPHSDSLYSKQILYMSEGSLVIIGNLIVILAIISNHALRRRQEIILLVALAVADAMAGVALFCGGSRRMLMLWKYETQESLPKVSSWYCMTTFTTPLFTMSDIAPPTMLLMIAGDRLYAVVRPLNYKKKKRVALPAVLTGTFFIIGFLLVGLGSSWDLPPDEVHSILCMSESSYAAWYPKLLHGTTMVISWAGIIMYAGVAGQMAKMTQLAGSTSASVERQKAVTKTALVVALCTALFHTLPLTAYWLMFVTAGENVADRFGQPVGILAAFNSGINVIIYITRHKELRGSILGLLRCQYSNNFVGPMTGSQASMGVLAPSSISVMPRVHKN